MSNYIQTFTGTKVHYPFNDPGEILIVDIAHALSNACRFTGHTHEHWSVAQHSMGVADLVPDEHKKQALLHDATEAYLCDIPTPFKRMMDDYMRMECELWKVIAERFDVPEELHGSVKEADLIMLMTERDILNPNNRGWAEHYEAAPRSPATVEMYRGYSIPQIEQMFMEKYREYAGF